MPLASCVGGMQSVAPGPISQLGAPTSNFVGQLGQEYFDKSTTPPTLYIYNGQTWAAQQASGGTGVFSSLTVSGTSSLGTTNVTGNFTASGSITSTLGDITATNGNIVRGTAGNKDVYSSVATTTAAGANSAGTVTLVSGTATVATTAVTANSQIRIYRQGVGATGAAALGILTIGTKTAGVSFVINAVTAASAIANQTTDVSVVGWEIVN